MKEIQSVQMWNNGQAVEATILNAYAVNVTLGTAATFWWGLFTEGSEPGKPGVQVSQGNLTLDGQAYIDWNANPDINDDAYLWIATQLSLTII